MLKKRLRSMYDKSNSDSDFGFRAYPRVGQDGHGYHGGTVTHHGKGARREQGEDRHVSSLSIAYTLLGFGLVIGFILGYGTTWDLMEPFIAWGLCR